MCRPLGTGGCVGRRGVLQDLQDLQRRGERSAARCLPPRSTNAAGGPTCGQAVDQGSYRGFLSTGFLDACGLAAVDVHFSDPWRPRE